MPPNPSIQEQIARVGDKLTPTERRVAQEVVRESLSISADIDIYTNDQITVEELEA